MKKNKAVEISMPKMQKQSSVNIKKVNNGFVVSGYKGNWDNQKTFIAKTQAEAKKMASKLL